MANVRNPKEMLILSVGRHWSHRVADRCPHSVRFPKIYVKREKKHLTVKNMCSQPSRIKMVLDLENGLLEFFEAEIDTQRKIYTLYLSEQACEREWFPCAEIVLDLHDRNSTKRCSFV